MKQPIQKLSYRRLYFRHALVGLFMAAIWGGYYALDKLTEGSRILIRFLAFALMIAAVFVTMTFFLGNAARRDREDELARENIAKTNSGFIRFLAFAGFVLFMVCTCFVGKPQKITVEIHYAWIASVIYLFFAVYYFIAMFYEAKTEAQCAGEEQDDA